MANTVLLKKSSVASKVPLTSDLAYGEVALNYTDGKLYFKNSSNAIQSFISDLSSYATLSGTETLTNKTLTSPIITGGTINNTPIGATTANTGAFTTVTASGIVSGSELTSSNSIGDEGGQINLAKAVTNTTLVSGITIDVYQNKLRIFEQGGTNRGVYIDLSSVSTGVGTNLIASGGGVTTNALTIGTGLSGTSFNGSAAVTIAIDSTVATLAGVQTLTNKTISTATNTISGLTNTNLSGTAGITNANLANSSITINSTAVSLGGTITGLATTAGTLAQFGATTSLQLAGVISDETGSGSLVFATSPSLVTPILGTPQSGNFSTGTFTWPTFNQNTTGSAGSVANTLTIGSGLTGTSYNGSAAVTITNSAPMVYPASGIPNSTGTAWGTSYSTTGSGTILALATSPAISTSITTASTSFDLINTTATTVNFAKAATALSIGAATGTTTINNDLTVTGDFVVNGSVVTVNSTTITVDDKNIELGSVTTPTNTTADGGGITLKGTTDKTFNWINSTLAWTSSEHLDLAAGKAYYIAGTAVLSGTALGTGVVTSSLTSVGTITSGTWSSGFGAVSGANLTNLTAGNLTGTIPSAVLGNSTVYIGSTAVALNRATGSLALTGISSIDGSAATLTTARTINGVSFNGSTNITITAANPNALTIGTGLSGTSYDGSSIVTIGIDSTVATLTGSQTLTNKTINLTSNTLVATSAQLAAAVTDETGSGSLVFATSPTLVTPNIGDAVATKVTLSNGASNLATMNVVQATIATVTPTAIDTWALASFRSAKYVVQITQGTNYQVTEILVLHNGTTTFNTQYAQVETNGQLATFTTDVASTNARLLVTMGSATSATINIQATMMAV